MKERRLTFTDLDENPLVVRLKQDRIELSVYDSHPELAAGELRRFASALFAAYLGPHLVAQVTEARAQLRAARDAPRRRGAAPAGAALDVALRALDDVLGAMTNAGALDAAALPRSLSSPSPSPLSSPSPSPSPLSSPSPSPLSSPLSSPLPSSSPRARPERAYPRLDQPPRGSRSRDRDEECGWGWQWAERAAG